MQAVEQSMVTPEHFINTVQQKNRLAMPNQKYHLSYRDSGSPEVQMSSFTETKAAMNH